MRPALGTSPVEPTLPSICVSLWDGLICVMPRMSDEYLAMLEQSSRPVVLINYCKHATGLPVVNGENFNGARDATHHLIDLGHRRIAFSRGFGYTGQSEERERGYRAALDDGGIAFDPRTSATGRLFPAFRGRSDGAPAQRGRAPYCDLRRQR
jgi:DNA-binding LacI/PurR family transcriptional regulator